MSHNQSRADTRESYQYKRSASFNQHRGGGRGSGGGRGGGAAAPPPPVSSTSNPSLTSNKSFNKKYNNVQGGQPRVSGASAGAGVGSDFHLNGAHQQQPLRGASDVSVASAHAPLPNAATVKPTDASIQKVTRAVPRAPTSNVVAPTSDLTAPVTPAKNPGDASRSFPLQFGSISPGVMNVLQIPARTSSAPPNLDKQKRAQARSDTSRAIPSLPNPSTSKQPMPRKDAGPIDPSNPSDAHGVASKPRRDVQISAPPPVAQTQKATHPMPGMHMPIPFHQPQVPVQFGGPGLQIPSHSMSATSLPMPMHLPIVNPPMQQPMFVSGLQLHPMQSQGMMHQGKGLNFSSGMGPQLPPQLGNMGMNMPSHFSPQQAGKFLGQRKTVKITHPDTHEELRLDVTHGSRSHPNMPPQSQPIAPFPPGHPNYYPNSYNSSSAFFLASCTLPLGNTQSSQPPRSFSQVTVKPAAGGTHPGKEQLPPVSSAAFGKDPVYFNSRASDVSVASAHAPLPNATVKPTDASTQKVTRAVPRAPTSNIVAPTSELMAPVTPAKRASDVSVTGLVSKSSSGVKKKSLVDSNVPKVTVTRGKKKRKCIYKKADAAGATSDLYMAYKGPEKKDELTESIEAIELTSSDNSKPLSADAPQEDLRSTKKVGEAKAVPDDWEDAADVSTPKLEADPEHGKKVDGEDGDGLTTKKYSRDFLLKFAEQCRDIPEGFNVAPDIADIWLNANASVSRESCPSPGRGIDRPSSGHRERRGSGIGDADKWSKTPGPLMPGRDLQPDFVYGGNVMGFRPGPGGNYGVLRNPRATMPIQFAGGQYPGGILSGPMQSMGPHGGGLRNGVDADRWQRGTAFQKGLMPSPPTPAQIMHKAEIKYEVGKVTDEEQAKQRQLKAILNKLTPQNFEKLFQQVKEVNIDNVVTLTGVISQIFDKALMEPTFCEMYANFCLHLAAELPDLSVDNEKITFKRLLLNKCQEEFEKGEREEQEANVTNEEGEVKLSAEEREGKRVKARRRMLGNIRLIGELYKKRMLTERIMHECIKKLLGDYLNPDEENVEALCKLMSTIGEMIDHAKAKEHMDAYFDRMEKLSNNMKLSSRVRFMLKDSIDLRKNKWQQRRKVEGPKKIEEVHRDAAQERHLQATRLARTPSLGGSSRRGQPMDFAPRGSMLSSPGPQMGGFRPVSPQVRGYGLQDVRVDERHSFENRTLSLPLTQRPLGDDPITLGPQGGLAKGMSSRGQPAGPSISFTDNMPSFGDSRRMTHAQNGYGSLPERTPYGSREELMPKYMPERLSSQHDQASAPERNMSYGSKDRGFDTSRPASPLVRSGGPTSTQNVALDKIWPEERLRDMSLAAIKEFYSAKDEKEVALCVKDLNSPSFYPSMISLWVTDSFERKDMERDLLAKLIIDLTISRDVALSQDQLIKGFENVLTTLEDAVNDAPRAAEFLGRIFAKVILENVVPFNEIGHLIYKGGEEEGRLVEIGLAAEVVGSTLEMIKLEQGDSAVSELCRSSNMRLENFRPQGSKKQWKLDKFI